LSWSNDAVDVRILKEALRTACTGSKACMSLSKHTTEIFTLYYISMSKPMKNLLELIRTHFILTRTLSSSTITDQLIQIATPSQQSARLRLCLQNILYQPFGLKCGHRFCKACLMRAVGLKGAYEDPEKLLAALSPGARCPECEQPGMGKGAIYI